MEYMKRTIGINKLIIDGEEIKSKHAELIIELDLVKTGYIIEHSYRKGKIEVHQPYTHLVVSRRIIDIEMQCDDGIRRGCQGTVVEGEYGNGEISYFSIMVVGKVNEHILI